MRKDQLISNAHRTCSLSIPSVELEAAGGQDVLGYRAVNGTRQPTGFAVGLSANDPLELLIQEEDMLGLNDDL